MRAALKLRDNQGQNVYESKEDARNDYEHVRSITKLADASVTFRDVCLHYWNLVELRRQGKGIEEWLETTGF